MKVLIIGRTRFIGTRAVRRIYNVDHVDAGRFNYAAAGELLPSSRMLLLHWGDALTMPFSVHNQS